MNLVFGSEVALLGFWEYMIRILVTVWFKCAAEFPQVEVAHDRPEILVFHDVIGRNELEEIKLLAQPLVVTVIN